MIENPAIVIKVETLDDVDLEDAYNAMVDLSNRLGGIPIQTYFNGVSLIYKGQSFGVFEQEYCLKSM